ncbi:MAG: integrase family protein [Rubrivivax sp.]|nr:integrase family protein [Rubrivivax sp.]
MQERPGRITDRRALSFPVPDDRYRIHWCPATPGFGVRVTINGARAWVAERRIDGKTVRRTLGRVSGRGAISADAARKLMVDVSSELQRGVDRFEQQREEKEERKRADAEVLLTFERGLEEYVAKKRRAKDGLGLKARTKADYLAMVREGGVTESGRQLADGELFALAKKPMTRISAEDMRAVYRTASARGRRRGIYAMQVTRAVFNWHGIKVPGNPLGKDVAGKDRIVLGKTSGNPKPIPPERLAAWWSAATALEGREAADYFRVLLLSGARPGELAGVAMRNFDAAGSRLILRDTKNRLDHIVLLPRQAAQIVERYAKGKRAGQRIFKVVDGRKALTAINLAAGTSVKPHGLRATFASVAEELVSAYTLKRLLNHLDSDDVTGGHYILKSESQLRAAWQAVADFITGAKPTKGT